MEDTFYVCSEGRDGFLMVNVATFMSSAYLVFYYQISILFPIIRKAKAPQKYKHMFLGANPSVEFSKENLGIVPQVSRKDIDRNAFTL